MASLLVYSRVSSASSVSHKSVKEWTNILDYRTSHKFEPLNVKNVRPSNPVNITSRNQKTGIMASTPFGASETGKPVYVSLTTISSRQTKAYETILNLLRGTVQPTHIYLFISKEPYLIDLGIPENSINPNLRSLASQFPNLFSIVYTNNDGPHRKLLPLLARKWSEDCLIITVDDESESGDHTTKSEIVASLINYYHGSKHEDAVALRARRIGVCRSAPYNVLTYRYWPVVSPNRKEMLLMPTGTGGILYRPKFFHPIIFDRRFIKLTEKADDLMFRMSTMAGGVQVTVGCLNGHRGRTCPQGSRIKLAVGGIAERKAMYKVFNESVLSANNALPATHATSADERGAASALNHGSEGQTKRASKGGQLVFPKAWGPPPTDLADDRVALPGGYGKGSSSLVEWIESKLQETGEGTQDADRRRLGGAKPITSLFQVNWQGGNDAAWRRGIEYLRSRGLAVVGQDAMKRIVPYERKYCLPEFWESIISSNPNVYKSISVPSPTRSCAIKRCRVDRDDGDTMDG